MLGRGVAQNMFEKILEGLERRVWDSQGVTRGPAYKTLTRQPTTANRAELATKMVK